MTRICKLMLGRYYSPIIKLNLTVTSIIFITVFSKLQNIPHNHYYPPSVLSTVKLGVNSPFNQLSNQLVHNNTVV